MHSAFLYKHKNAECQKYFEDEGEVKSKRTQKGYEDCLNAHKVRQESTETTHRAKEKILTISFEKTKIFHPGGTDPQAER